MTLTTFLEVLAILVGALSGFAEARNKRMDLVGVFIVAFITAFGGGTLRDILLDKRPLFWVLHQEYAILIAVLSLIATPVLNASHKFLPQRLIVIADALGLGLFSIVGVSTALEAGMPVFIASMMGVITGIFGGVMRDVICNEVPMVLRDGRPYAVCAFAGCWMYLAMQYVGVPSDFSLWVSALSITAMRLVTWAGDIRLG
ncbi:trimeric intracellular cation channel family protein [Noviherbaspirillum cavernae]|uniref:Trimeric intracellular cation channel family protein n=1 Tax=Noviherbaspirillum cavernae TaxID=2320862 RepID=A0A418WZJ5_9BURK|nr:trimeric intracellular cation channel family protein [Noviherbaspirillum cavernae]RJG05658.1 trimeric intracellular cation channel family protein [Noviherbaspirillum cavernae]